MEEIIQAWRTFLAMAFPRNNHELQDKNANLEILRDTAVECLAHFLRWEGSMARNKQTTLSNCIHSTQSILPELEASEREYFLCLLNLSQMAINYNESITEQELTRRQDCMRYYRVTVEEGIEWGATTYWFEVNEQGHAARQINYYANGNSLSYDQTHEHDDYSGLQEMVVDGDDEWWIEYTISKEEFELEWQSHNGMNRNTKFKEKLGKLWSELPTVNEPIDVEDDGIPF